ncbi:hypothetical protein [Terrihalobacillus insolitus]|uniref:hypothetical protein n=1 Tax=Terrihalobacillus insolitus TaxID=2950438 RepID=UPI00233FB672|nr:hypothetical protein [Terrihalobacillus insolitus]MDC3414301.1 hypothetical protein [Terrihalobacillus insolitus]
MQIAEINGFSNRLKEIVECDLPSSLKDIRLASLMSDMEQVYQIPTISKRLREAFENKHPEVMELYKRVSMARSFE